MVVILVITVLGGEESHKQGKPLREIGDSLGTTGIEKRYKFYRGWWIRDDQLEVVMEKYPETEMYTEQERKTAIKRIETLLTKYSQENPKVKGKSSQVMMSQFYADLRHYSKWTGYDTRHQWDIGSQVYTTEMADIKLAMQEVENQAQGIITDNEGFTVAAIEQAAAAVRNNTQRIQMLVGGAGGGAGGQQRVDPAARPLQPGEYVERRGVWNEGTQRYEVPRQGIRDPEVF